MTPKTRDGHSRYHFNRVQRHALLSQNTPARTMRTHNHNYFLSRPKYSLSLSLSLSLSRARTHTHTHIQECKTYLLTQIYPCTSANVCVFISAGPQGCVFITAVPITKLFASVCLLLQYLLQSCSRRWGGDGTREGQGCVCLLLHDLL